MDEAIKILSQTEIERELESLPGWSYADNKISKQFEFAAYVDGINLINELVPFCNRLDHHPDIHIYYKKIKFELQRFDVGGKVTNKDFLVAHEIERLYRELISI